MTNSVSRTISDATLSRIIQIESGGNPGAKAATSSAKGLGQFLNGTWLDELQKHRPDLFNGPPFDDELALRTNPSIAIELLARHTEGNARLLGRGATDGDLYLAHFSGVGVAKKLLRADPEAGADTCYSRSAIAANRSILQDKTVGEVRAWAARKMAGAGRTDWVNKYYRPGGSTPVPLPRPQPPDADRQAAVADDERMRQVQRQLKAMNYSPGGVDGDWGGMLTGALASFIGDRSMGIAAPTSLEMFEAVRPQIEAEIALAEAEGFKRPVSAARANADIKKVEQVAPEVVPVQRNFFAAAWASFLTFVAAAYNTVSGYVTAAWNFFTDHKDNIPGDGGWLNTAFEYVGKVPSAVWLALAGCGLAYVAFNSMRGVQSITASVQTGERQ